MEIAQPTELHRLDDPQITGSLGLAVMNYQFWRQLHCRLPAVQLLA